jgi:hypothetical protein
VAVSRDDMVRAFADLLKPWADPYQQRDVIAGINEQIGDLEAALPELSREGVRATRESARRILGAIADLQRKIAELQHECDGGASPEVRERLAGIRCRPDYVKPLDDNFVKTLADIKRECDAAIEATLTEGRRNQVKEWCARLARALFVRFSKSRPTSGSANSPYRYSAGLFCKIIDPTVTDGDKIPDLERECKAVLKAMPIGTKRSKKIS